MEDPLGDARRALYSRISGRSISTLFTRPSVLALADEAGSELPIQALNQVCRTLMNTVIEADSDVPGTINRIAEESGFIDIKQFLTMFQIATGWLPDEWYSRFCCNQALPRRN